MHAYRTEGSYRSAARMTAAELRAAMASREILQSTALAFDTQRQLRFELGGVKAVMPFAQCADGADAGAVRDIAVLTRVGRPTCFVIEGLDTDPDGQPFYRLSRAEAQRMCKVEYLDSLQPGDILRQIPLFPAADVAFPCPLHLADLVGGVLFALPRDVPAVQCCKRLPGPCRAVPQLRVAGIKAVAAVPAAQPGAPKSGCMTLPEICTDNSGKIQKRR